METPPPEALLCAYPDATAAIGEQLRAVVRLAVPAAREQVRMGWRLIGYDIPVGRGTRYFAYISPEPIHIHLGFEHGALMHDPGAVLEGAHLRLRRVRFLTFTPGSEVITEALVPLVREAARVAALGRSERLALALELEGRG
jgi:hypothetical protein